MQDSLNTFNKIKNAELIQDYFALNSRLNDMAAAERNTSEIKQKLKWQSAVIISLSFSLIIVLAILLVTYYFYTQKNLAQQKA